MLERIDDRDIYADLWIRMELRSLLSRLRYKPFSIELQLSSCFPEANKLMLKVAENMLTRLKVSISEVHIGDGWVVLVGLEYPNA